MTGGGNGGRKRARWVFQVETGGERAVIKVLDTRTDTVFREIPIEEFLEFARTNKDVAAFFLGKLAPTETPQPAS